MKAITVVLSLCIALNYAPTYAFTSSTQIEEHIERNAGAGFRCIWRGKNLKLNKHKCIW